MRRRSGFQSGYLEIKGNAWVVRFWEDVEGSDKRGSSQRSCLSC